MTAATLTKDKGKGSHDSGVRELGGGPAGEHSKKMLDKLGPLMHYSKEKEGKVGGTGKAGSTALARCRHSEPQEIVQSVTK